jgi:inosine-uridine nucleoside N-ribohydrolase
MKRILVFIFLLAVTLTFAKPQKVIFDTDMGNDIDDALALAMLYDYQESGKAKVLAILLNKDHIYSPIFTSILNNYYGYDFPIGIVRDGATKFDRHYIIPVSELKNADGSYRFARKIDKSSKIIDAVKLARKVLAESENGEVIYISVGFSTNVARLLESSADEYSPLSGRELVAKKVKYFSIMAGQFAKTKTLPTFQPEFNVKQDIKSAKLFFENSPVPIIFSGIEVGLALRFPQIEIEKQLSKNNVLGVAYHFYALGVNKNKSDRHDRPTWDLTSVQYVFSPELWEVSEPIKIKVNDNGLLDFSTDSTGKYRYLIIPKNGKDKIMNDLIKRVLSPIPMAEK